MKWETVKLSECCSSITDGDHQPPPKSESGVPFVTIANINSLHQFDFSNTMFVPQEYYDRLDSKRKAQIGDVLYSVVGSFGIPVLIKDNVSFAFQRHIAILRPNERILPAFLYYTMLTSAFYTKADAAAIGAAQRTISLNALRSIDIDLPPIEVQQGIVRILSPYDNLIENNQMQIKLLEEVAQRLYKEWFIDLRFPGHESTPIHDGMPEGWQSLTVGDTCILQKNMISPDAIPQGTPYIGLEHIPRKDFCLSIWGDASEVSSNKCLFSQHDIIFGQIRPYFHKVGFAIIDGVASTDSFVIKPFEGIWGLFLMTVSSEKFVNYSYQTCKEGAKMPRADWNQMKNYPIFVPNDIVLSRFEELIRVITEKVTVLAFQNRQLSEARDRLLPKLMSGEIEV